VIEKTYTCKPPCPLAHRYILYIMLGSVYLLFMGLTLPFPLPQQSIPVGIFIVAFFLEGVFG